MSLWALLVLAAADPDLAAAEHSFEDAHYENVLPALERALSHPLPPAEQRRALELLAFTHAAFDDRTQAIEAFRRLLGVDPEYEPRPSDGPKVRGWWEHAKRLGARPPPAPPPPLDLPKVEPRVEAPVPKLTPRRRAPEPPPVVVRPPPDEEPAIYERWYIWAGVGAAAAVATAVVVGIAAAKPAVPQGNLGTGALR